MDDLFNEIERLLSKDMLAFMFGLDGDAQIKLSKGKIVDYPLDIYYTGEHNDLNIEVALVGATKDDVKVEMVDGDTLQISYTKPTEKPIADKKDEPKYVQRMIKRSNLKLPIKLLGRYDTDKIKIKLENGLLKVFAPVADVNKARELKID